VACEVPDDVKEAIGEVIETLRSRSGTAVRWIRAEGVHVTLKFLGEVPVRQLPAIKLAIQEAVVGHSPFELEFSNIGTFGGREGLRIMWVGIAGDVLRLEALVRAVNAALAVVGFEPERRPFRPHLLGRVRGNPDASAGGDRSGGGQDGRAPVADAAQVSLVGAAPAAGASCEVLATFPARGPAPALTVVWMAGVSAAVTSTRVS
jgi:2'-5' RNA ligase